MSRESKILREHYQDCVYRGWERGSFSEWRGRVISRINKMYGTSYKNLPDVEILNYFKRAKFYRV